MGIRTPEKEKKEDRMKYRYHVENEHYKNMTKHLGHSLKCQWPEADQDKKQAVVIRCLDCLESVVVEPKETIKEDEL